MGCLEASLALLLLYALSTLLLSASCNETTSCVCGSNEEETSDHLLSRGILLEHSLSQFEGFILGRHYNDKEILFRLDVKINLFPPSRANHTVLIALPSSRCLNPLMTSGPSHPSSMVTIAQSHHQSLVLSERHSFFG